MRPVRRIKGISWKVIIPERIQVSGVFLYKLTMNENSLITTGSQDDLFMKKFFSLSENFFGTGRLLRQISFHLCLILTVFVLTGCAEKNHREAEELCQNGIEYLLDNELNEAFKCFNNAILQSPKFADA